MSKGTCTFFLIFPVLAMLAQEKLAMQLYELAEQKVQSKDWIKAKDYLNQCVNAKPGFIEAYALRGDVNEKLDRPKEALTDYNIALGLNPGLTDCYLKRGVLAYSLNRFDLAIPDFKRLLHIQTEETNMVYFRQTNNESFDKIFTLQSGIKDMLYNYLGLIETKNKNYKTALLYFDSAIMINPNSPDYFAHRGLAFLSLEDFSKATVEFERALKLDSDHALSKNNLAALRRKEGRLDEAEKYLNEAKAVSQRTPDHYGNLGLLQYESGRFKEAILNFDSAIQLSPSDGDLFINRGLAKERINDMTGALQDFTQAIRIDPEWPKAWFVQGNHFVKQKEWNKALENFTVAITFNPEYALAFYNRSIVYYHLKEFDKACHDLLMAKRKEIQIEEKMEIKFCQK